MQQDLANSDFFRTFAGEITPVQKQTPMDESIEIIKIEQLKSNLEQAISNGYADYVVNFCAPEDFFTIDRVYLMDENHVRLDSHEDSPIRFTAQQLLNELNKFANNCYVYVYDNYEVQIYDIEPDLWEGKNYDHRWYVDEDNYLRINISLRWEVE